MKSTDGFLSQAIAIRKGIGDGIRKRRAKAEMSQRELASIAGISVFALNRIEKGKAMPTDATLQRIDEAFSACAVEDADESLSPIEEKQRPRSELPPTPSQRQPKRHAEWVMQSLQMFFEDPMKSIDFMRAFCGCTIVIPEMPMIETLAREHFIVQRMQRDSSEETMKHLTNFHGITRKQLRKIVQK